MGRAGSVKDIALETVRRAGRNNITIVAAGVAFYVFLAMVPLIAATVLVYGLVAEPAMVERHIGALREALPAEAAELFADQLRSVVESSDGKKGLGLIAAMALALFGARNGAASVLTALNIAHGVPEARNLLKANLVALAITAGGVMAIIVAVGAMATMATLTRLLPLDTAMLGTIGTYLISGLVGTAGVATLFRFAPNRTPPHWKAVLPGAALTAIGWLLLTMSFGLYVSNFGNFNATYGSLSAVAILLTWLWASALILMLGAELNAALGDRRAGHRGLDVG